MIDELVFVQTAPNTVENRIKDIIENQLRTKDKVNELIMQREKDKTKRDTDIENIEEKIAVINKEIQYLKKRLGIIK